MKRTISLWLKASFALFAVSVVGATIAAFSLASYEPGTPERCDQLGKLMGSGQISAADKDEYYKYCAQQQPMHPAATNETTPSWSCDDLAKIIASGQYSTDQKDQWLQCQQDTHEPSTLQPSDTLRTCEDLKKLIESGNATPDQKDKWANCQAGQNGEQSPYPSYTCDELKTIIDSGSYNADQKQLWLNCQQGYNPVPNPAATNDPSSRCQDLMYMIKKYSADTSSSEYQNSKAEYNKLCVNDAQNQSSDTSVSNCDQLKSVIGSGKYTYDQKQQWLKCQNLGNQAMDQAQKDCEELRAKLEKLSVDPSSQDYGDTKAQYVKTCYRQEQDSQAKMLSPNPAQNPTPFVPEDARCKDLRAKMVAMNNSGQANTQDYMDLKVSFKKSCEKANSVPPAGYEDVVLTNPDTYSNPFPDTNINDRQGKAAAELYRRGVLGGFPDGEFKGDKPVNRAEASKFLLLACGKDTQADYSGKFHDLLKGQWYVPYVEAASSQGIINGYADGTFRPANTVNRAEFSKMITLACQLPTDLDHSLFTDVKEGDWFATYAGAVQKYSLYPDSVVDNLFKPANLMTRSEVAIAIYQYLTNR